MKDRKRRGFTLLESLLTIFLFALALAVVARLVTGSQQLLRQSAGKSQALKTCQWALSEIRQQVEAAARLDEPSIGSSNRLLLSAYRQDTVRLPATLPSWKLGRDPWWNPYDSRYLESLEFRLDTDQLVKVAGGNSAFLAGSVDSFQVSVLDEQLEIEIEVRGRTRNSRFVSRVVKP